MKICDCRQFDLTARESKHEVHNEFGTENMLRFPPSHPGDARDAASRTLKTRERRSDKDAMLQ